MAALATFRRALVPKSAYIRRERANHARALSAPMHRIQMVCDPHLGSAAWIGAKEGQAQLEKRACQYAAWLAERAGLARRAIRDYDARYTGKGEVVFEHYGDGRREEFAVTIPREIMEFDPTAAPLMIEGPETAQEPAPRCEHTLDMLGADPAPVSAAPIAIAKTAATRHRAPRATRRDLIGALELGRIRAAAHQVRIDR